MRSVICHHSEENSRICYSIIMYSMFLSHHLLPPHCSQQLQKVLKWINQTTETFIKTHSQLNRPAEVEEENSTYQVLPLDWLLELRNTATLNSNKWMKTCRKGMIYICVCLSVCVLTVCNLWTGAAYIWNTSTQTDMNRWAAASGEEMWTANSQKRFRCETLYLQFTLPQQVNMMFSCWFLVQLIHPDRSIIIIIMFLPEGPPP